MRFIVAAIVAVLALTPASVLADERGREHDAARDAVAQREALPLTRILAVAQAAVPGEVIEVELEREDGRLLYEVEILAHNGRVRTVTLDARTGRIIEVEDDD